MRADRLRPLIAEYPSRGTLPRDTSPTGDIMSETSFSNRESPRPAPRLARVRDGAVFALGLGLGALAAYLLDPNAGARRRAVFGDQARSAARSSGRRGLKALRHTRNQLGGVLANATAFFTPVGPASDRKLVERLRSRLGHVAQHLEKLELDVHRGDVLVRGQLKESEVQSLLKTIASTRGVRSVTDNIERYSEGQQPLQ